MAATRLPSYTHEKDGAFNWTRPSWANPAFATHKDEVKRRLAVRKGKTCPVASSPLGSDLATAIAKADSPNEAFKEWRTGMENVPTKGTIGWLFAWHRTEDRFTSKSRKTRSDYKKLMDMLVDVQTKAGRLGVQLAAPRNTRCLQRLGRPFLALIESRTSRLAA